MPQAAASAIYSRRRTHACLASASPGAPQGAAGVDRTARALRAWRTPSATPSSDRVMIAIARHVAAPHPSTTPGTAPGP
ncbi:hypothetical protein GGF41_007447, partial [Coemansia sp. RSA 2531]